MLGISTTPFTNCYARRDLQEKSWILVSKLATATGLLCKVAGTGHSQEFAETKDRCAEVRGEVKEAQRQLRLHRSAHGC